MSDLTDQIALVVPPEGPTRRVTFRINGAPRLIDVVHREIKPTSDTLDSSSTIRTQRGPFRYWTDDTALKQPDLPHNDRVIALCRAHGYDLPDARGTIVICGGVSDLGDCLGLRPSLLGFIEEHFNAPDAAAAPVEHRPVELVTLTGQDAIDYLLQEREARQ